MRARAFLAALALTGLLACTPLVAQRPAPARPTCADRVALAFTSTAPVKGAYACMAMNYGDRLADAGVVSDDSWAAHNKEAGQREPFVFEARLHDGAYLYHEDVHISTGQMVTLDLILWIAKDGSVYTFDLVSVVDG